VTRRALRRCDVIGGSFLGAPLRPRSPKAANDISAVTERAVVPSSGLARWISAAAFAHLDASCFTTRGREASGRRGGRVLACGVAMALDPLHRIAPAADACAAARHALARRRCPGHRTRARRSRTRRESHLPEAHVVQISLVRHLAAPADVVGRRAGARWARVPIRAADPEHEPYGILTNVAPPALHTTSPLTRQPSRRDRDEISRPAPQTCIVLVVRIATARRTDRAAPRVRRQHRVYLGLATPPDVARPTYLAARHRVQAGLRMSH